VNNASKSYGRRAKNRAAARRRRKKSNHITTGIRKGMDRFFLGGEWTIAGFEHITPHTDCDTATVTVQQDARVHTFSCYAVEEMAEHYPRAADLNILKKTIAEVYKAVGES
jgi:hypothetical protein